MTADHVEIRGVPRDSIANRLMLARAEAGHISIREAALMCGLGRGAWQNWERGRSEPGVSTILLIAERLDVDGQWLALGGQLAAPTRPTPGPGHGAASSAGTWTENRPGFRIERRLRSLPKPVTHISPATRAA